MPFASLKLATSSSVTVKVNWVLPSGRVVTVGSGRATPVASPVLRTSMALPARYSWPLWVASFCSVSTMVTVG